MDNEINQNLNQPQEEPKNENTIIPTPLKSKESEIKNEVPKASLEGERLQKEQIKVEIKEENKEDKSEPPFPYNIRKWVPNISKEELYSKLEHPNHLIRVVHYNLLCDSLLPISLKINEDDIPKVPYLLWENRSKKIIEELKVLDGDLLGLEEVERDEKFIKQLNDIGYDFALKPRSGNHSEGCAIAWKINKFELIDLICLEFNMNKTKDNISPVFDRDNVALIGILKVKELSNTIILFAAAHLIYNIKRGDIKLGQAYQLTQTLDLLRKKYEEENKNKVYIILTSDLNSVPKSGTYKLLTKGKLDCNLLDFHQLSGVVQDNLQYVRQANKIKGFIFNNITACYQGEKPEESKFKKDPKKFDYKKEKEKTIDNRQWFNEICRIKPVFVNEHNIILDYDSNYKYKENDLILELPFVYQSAYAIMTQKCVDYLEGKINELPFNLFRYFDNIEINGIKMRKNNIKDTVDFIKDKTLENLVSCYSNDTILSLDYIFYYSKNNDAKVVSILNGPDIFKLCFDFGYMPNEVFPSDHLSIAADIVIGGEK